MTTRIRPRTNGTPAPGDDGYDVVVIGGGAAGLSGALTLARARRSVLVIDDRTPRNAPAAHAHGYLTRDGIPPLQILAIGRQEVTGYGGSVMEGVVSHATRLDDGRFRVTLEAGTTVAARRLLVTTGLVDELPGIPGLREHWGRDVLHCPYCHGWEVRDQPIGVVGTGPLAVHQALLWRQWSEDVTLFLHTAPEPDDEEYERLAARGISVVTGTVTALESSGTGLSGVRLEDGHLFPVRAATVTPLFTARSAVLESLGLVPVPMEMNGHVVGHRVTVDARGATDVPGVFAAGNVTDLTAQVVGAAAAGVTAGAGINMDLIGEETRAAVEARRRPFSAEAEVCGRVLADGKHGW